MGRMLWVWHVVRAQLKRPGYVEPGDPPPAVLLHLERSRKESLELQSKWRLQRRSFWLLLAPIGLFGARSQMPSFSWFFFFFFFNCTVMRRV